MDKNVSGQGQRVEQWFDGSEESRDATQAMGGRSSTAYATQRRGQHAPCAYTRGQGHMHAGVRSEQRNVAHACLCFACAFALVFPEGKGQEVRIGSGSQETTTSRRLVEDW